MTKLFKLKPTDELRSVRYELRLTVAEAETIQTSAMARNLSVAEYIRRVSLGRKTDLRYETEIVLALSGVVNSIRQMHAALVDHGVPPPEDELRSVIQQAIAAMLRISK